MLQVQVATSQLTASMSRGALRYSIPAGGRFNLTPLSKLYFGINRLIGSLSRSGRGLVFFNVYLEFETPKNVLLGSVYAEEAKRECVYNGLEKYCQCDFGYQWDTKKMQCVDIDECAEDSHLCVHKCINTPGHYKCGCHVGFQPDPKNPFNCIDIDECSALVNPCGRRLCHNIIGWYQCMCSLKDTDEEVKAGECVQYHYDQVGFDGLCPSGTVRRNGRCIYLCWAHDTPQLPTNRHFEVVRNALPLAGCHHDCQPINGPDRHVNNYCVCREGYALQRDGKSCKATCDTMNGGCQQMCEDTINGTMCHCDQGFYVDPHDPKKCIDINECEMGYCSHDCINREGGFECSCPVGYTLKQDERTRCIDINECDLQVCDNATSVCINVPGSYMCQCLPGYELFGENHCRYVDECLDPSLNTCEHTCHNTQGSFYCSCHQGYRLHSNQMDCVSTAKCLPLETPSNAKVNCFAHSAIDFVQQCDISCSSGHSFFRPEIASDFGIKEILQLHCIPGRSSWFDPRTSVTYETWPDCYKKMSEPAWQLGTIQVRLLFNNANNPQLGGMMQVPPSFINYCYAMRELLSTPEDYRKVKNKITKAIQLKDLCPETSDCKIQSLEVTDCLPGSSSSAANYFESYNIFNLTIHIMMKPPQQSNNSVSKSPSCVKVPPGDTCYYRRACVTRPQSLETYLTLMSQTLQDSCLSSYVFKYARSFRASGGFRAVHVETNWPMLYHPLNPERYIRQTVCRSDRLFFSWTLNSCERCPPNTMFNRQLQQCQACALGEHQPDGDSDHCLPCTLDAGSQGSCGGQCKPGHSSPDGSAHCLPCPKDMYQPDPWRTHCLPCDGGVVKPDTAATHCQLDPRKTAPKICEKNSYWSSTNRTCVACPRGHMTGHAGALSHRDCRDMNILGDDGHIIDVSFRPQLCPKGSYWSVASSNCQTCPKGFTTDYHGSLSIRDCKATSCKHFRVWNQEHVGYITSANWPHQYPTSTKCSIPLEIPPNKTAVFVLPSIDLGENTLLGDELKIYKTGSSAKVELLAYSSLQHPLIITSNTRQLTVKFTSDHNETADGFILFYVFLNDTCEDLVRETLKDSAIWNEPTIRESFADIYTIRDILNLFIDFEQTIELFKAAYQPGVWDLNFNLSPALIKHLTQKIIHYKTTSSGLNSFGKSILLDSQDNFWDVTGGGAYRQLC